MVLSGFLQEVVEHDAGLGFDGMGLQIDVRGQQADGFFLLVFVIGGDGL